MNSGKANIQEDVFLSLLLFESDTCDVVTKESERSRRSITREEGAAARSTDCQNCGRMPWSRSSMLGSSSRSRHVDPLSIAHPAKLIAPVR